jgi:hypothetical protein
VPSNHIPDGKGAEAFMPRGPDPEDKTGDANGGRQIIHEMELMLRRKRAAPK